MILSRRVALGGAQLDEISPWIVIRSVDHGVPKETISAVSQMGGSGQRITSAHWETMDVSVSYAIDLPKKRLEERRQIFEAVNAWANRGGWLTFSWMPNRRLYVDKVILPSMGDAWDWTNEYTITFRAYGVPFWQEATPNQAASGVQSSGSLWLYTGGDVRGVLDATFQNQSGMTISNFSISTPWSSLSLSGISLGGYSALEIYHGTDGLLRITAGGSSVYGKYSGSDDLYVYPGGATVWFSADRAGVLTVRNYGRYA
jgi:hypothetical protein